jgi:hypothetical protein
MAWLLTQKIESDLGNAVKEGGVKSCAPSSKKEQQK